MSADKTLGGHTEIYKYMCKYWAKQAELLQDRPKEFPVKIGTIRNKLSLLEIPVIFQTSKYCKIYCSSDDVENWVDNSFIGYLRK